MTHDEDVGQLAPPNRPSTGLERNPMLNTILQQQDDYFFADDERLISVLAWIRNHADQLRRYGSEARLKARLPLACVELLRSGGLFDLALNVERGGKGLTSAAQARALEELATIDASIAWCVMIGMDSGIYQGFLSPAIRTEIFPHAGIISAGWIHPQGLAIDLGNGTCRVNGRWQFGSGIDHADVILGGVRFATKEGSDDWTWRIVILDKADIKIEESWNTWGLQGSGSQHYHADNVIVRLERTITLLDPKVEGPLNRPHDAIVRKMAGIPLGVAVGAITAVASEVGRKTAELRSAREHPNDRVLNTIGRLTAELVALRSAVYSTLQSAWNIYKEASTTPDERNAALVATAAIRQRSFQTSRSLVIAAGDLLGAQAVYTAAGDLGARLSDLNVMAQHAVGQESLLDLAGNRILGGEASGPII